MAIQIPINKDFANDGLASAFAVEFNDHWIVKTRRLSNGRVRVSYMPKPRIKIVQLDRPTNVEVRFK